MTTAGLPPAITFAGTDKEIVIYMNIITYYDLGYDISSINITVHIIETWACNYSKIHILTKLNCAFA